MTGGKGQPWARKESPLRLRGGGCGGALAPCPRCLHQMPPSHTALDEPGRSRGRRERTTPSCAGVWWRGPAATRADTLGFGLGLGIGIGIGEGDTYAPGPPAP